MIVSIAFSILRGMDDELARSRVYDETVNKTFALNLLASRFRASQDPGAIRQIMQVRRSLDALLGSIATSEAPEEILVRQLRTGIQELDYLFSRLTGPAPGSTESGIEEERRHILVSQVSMKTQFISEDIHHLIDLSDARIQAAQRKTILAVVTLIVALTLINAAISFFSGRSIVRAEGVVREQREWLQVTLASIGDAVIAADKNGRVSFINPVAAALTGWSEEEARGRAIEDVFRILNEETRQPAEDIVRRVLNERQIVNLANHTSLVTRDGREIPIEDSAAPIRNKAGDVSGVVLVFHDVTERRSAQAALRDSEVQFRTMFELAAVGMAQADPYTGRILRVNEKYCRITGYSAGELIGARFSDFTHPDDVDRDWALFQAAVRGETPVYQNEKRYVRKDGAVVWVNVSAAMIRDEAARPVRTVAAIEDITERKRIEQALRESQEDLNRAQAVAHVGSWRLNVRRNELVWSDENHRIFGIPKETALTYESFLDRVHPDDRAYVHDKWTEALRGEPYDVEHRLLLDDTVKWVRERAELEFDEDGELLGGFGTTQDITERKQASLAVLESESRFRLLSTTAARLLAAQDPLSIVNELSRQVMAHLDCQAFFNFVAVDGVDRLHLNAYAGIPEEEARRIEWLDYGVAVCGCVARDRVRIVAEDICSVADPRTDLVKSYGIQAYACHPLIAGGKVIGTLSFGTKTRAHFSSQDLDLMKTVADQVAIAMERIRLIGELQKTRDQLEVRVADRTRQLALAIQSLEAEVDQREEAEKVLSEKNELLESILSSVHFLVAFLDRDFNYVRVNEAYARANKRSSASFTGKNHFEVSPDREDQAIFQQVLETGAPFFAMEKPFEHPDHPEWGTSYWDWSLQPVRGDSGEMVGLVLTRVDVTERRRAQEALRQSEQLLRTVLETMPVGVWITDRAGTISMANPAALKIWGGARYVGVECYGEYKGWWADTGKLIEPEEWALARAINRGEVSTNEIIDIQCFDGTRKTILNSAFPISDEHRQIVRAIVVNQDITGLRQVEKDLRKSEERLQQSIGLLQKIVDGIRDPLIMLDRDGRVTLINKAAMDYYGTRELANVLGVPCFEGLGGRESVCPACDYPFASVVTEPVTFERAGLHDPKRVESVTVYPVLNASGERDAIIIKTTDVTRTKLLDRQLLHNQKLASLGLMTSGIAHEINNPNSFIYFNIPILRQYLEELMPILDEYAVIHPNLELLHMSYGELKEDIFRLLENMEHGSQRINRIVGALKGFVRKRETDGLQPVDLKQVIDKVIALCHAEIKREVKSFEVVIAPDIPIIRSDPEALEQVLLNLIINAVHACDKEDSRVCLRVDLGQPPESQIQIEVSDNGIGIEEEHREMIFDPFFTTKLSSMGTGLGLYICHHRVESLGGVIEVDSSVGQGSTFRVLLPRTDAE